MAMPAQTPPNSVATEGITSPSGTFGESTPTVMAAVIKAIKALIFRRMMSVKTTAIAISNTTSG